MTNLVCWGIDIGKFSFKAVKMVQMRHRVEIQDIEYIPYDLKTGKEDEIQDAIYEALALFVEGRDFSNQSVAVALPGRVAFSRFINLPPVDVRKMRDFVSYEAQQQIPFSIDEVVWSYHCLTEQPNEGEEMEVGIFAIKREIVDSFLEELQPFQLDPDVLTIVPLALLNFFKHEVEAEEEGAILVVDVGADHTDLLVIQKDRFWLRNLPFAAKNFTNAIKKKLKVSYADAEKLKWNIGTSKHGKKIAKILRSHFEELADELNRSMGYYKSMVGQVKFKRIYLVGGGSKVHGLSQFLQKQLRVEVKRLTSRFLSNIQLSERLDLEILRDNFESFSVAIGLALQGLGKGFTEVNLLPPERLQAKAEVRRRPYLIGVCVLLFLAILVMSWTRSSEIQSAQAIQEKLSDPRIQGMTPSAYLRKMQQAVRRERSYQNLQKAIQGMLEVGRHRMMPLKILASLTKAVKENGKMAVKLPTGVQPRPPKDKPVLDQIQKSYQGKLWFLSLRYRDNFSYVTKKGNFQLNLTTAVHLEGNVSQSREKIAIPKLFQTIKADFRDYLPDEKKEVEKFQQAFRDDIPLDSKRYALSEEAKNEEDILHPISVFLLNLSVEFRRGEPLVKVEEVQRPKKRIRRRR